MTPSEARDYVIRHCNPDYPHGKTEWETAINMAIEALEKQIPKKIKMPMDAFFVCPVCAARIMSLDEFCIHCGQRIER
jgi:hypothetical protein